MARDLLQTGAAWLKNQLQANASQAITYTRGADSVALRGTLGKKLLQLQDMDGGVLLEWTDLDVLIPAADLMLDGETVEPRRGDRVTLVMADNTLTFEVQPIGTEPAWRYCDPFRTMIRVHAKFVASEPYA